MKKLTIEEISHINGSGKKDDNTPLAKIFQQIKK